MLASPVRVKANAQQAAITTWRFFESVGCKPTVRAVGRIMRSELDIKCSDADLKIHLIKFIAAAEKRREELARDMAAAANERARGKTATACDDTAAASAVPLHAHDKVFLVPEEQEKTTSFPTETEKKTEPMASKKLKQDRVEIDVPDCDFDFGEHEILVVEMLAVEASKRKDGKIAHNVIQRLRRQLAGAFTKHGPEAFGYGVGEAISRETSVPYALKCMPGYQPGTNVHPFRPRTEQLNASDILPTLADLVAAGEIEPWDMPVDAMELPL